MSEDLSLRKTPLYACHQEAGARLVGFAGWEMPVQYAGLMEEHRAVRGAAGLFDVSHMGEFSVRGPESEAFLQRLTPNDVSKLQPGRAHYSALLTEKGTYVDDLLVYRLGEQEFLVVVNAANIDKDFQWMRSHAEGDLDLENVSDRYALLALQGPRAMEILEDLTETDLAAIRYYRFAFGQVDGQRALISRTGYTGEDGFELYLSPEAAPAVWRKLLEVGADRGLQPAGLGARDTLRLEAAMALYGHEIDDTTTVRFSSSGTSKRRLSATGSAKPARCSRAPRSRIPAIGAMRGLRPPDTSASATARDSRSSASVAPPKRAARKRPSGLSARRACTSWPTGSLAQCSPR